MCCLDPWSLISTLSKQNLHWPHQQPLVWLSLVRVSPVWELFRGKLNIFSRDRTLCHEVYVVITGFPDPGAGNEKRALSGAKYFKDKSLQWIFSAKYLSISNKNKFLFTEPFARQSSLSLVSQTTSPLLLSDAGIPGFPAQWKLFDTNFQWSE